MLPLSSLQGFEGAEDDGKMLAMSKGMLFAGKKG